MPNRQKSVKMKKKKKAGGGREEKSEITKRLVQFLEKKETTSAGEKALKIFNPRCMFVSMIKKKLRRPKSKNYHLK